MKAQDQPEGADAAFGRRLRYLREQAGLTQQQLADVMREAGAKMHRSTIGKIEAGERPEDSLIRELKEELDIVVREACLAPLTFASHGYPDFHLLMPLYVCRRWEGTVRPTEGQEIAWVRPNRLRDYPMPPADEPLVSHLTTLL